jgi:hypothetical protein
MPGLSVLKNVIGSSNLFGIIALVGAPAVSAVVWAWGHRSRSHQAESNGKRGTVVTAGCALLLGAAISALTALLTYLPCDEAPSKARTVTTSSAPGVPSTPSSASPSPTGSARVVPKPPVTHDPVVFGKAAAAVLWSYDTRHFTQPQYLAGLRGWMTGEDELGVGLDEDLHVRRVPVVLRGGGDRPVPCGYQCAVHDQHVTAAWPRLAGTRVRSWPCRVMIRPTAAVEMPNSGASCGTDRLLRQYIATSRTRPSHDSDHGRPGRPGPRARPPAR